MTSLFAYRAAGALLTIIVVVSSVFIVIRLTGDPVSQLLPFDYTPEQKASLEEELGVDKPLPEQYFIFLKNGVRGDFGESFRWKESGFGLVRQRLPATLKLAGVAFVISLSVAIPLGTIAAAKRGTVTDSGIGVLTTVGMALPNFVLAVLLVWFIAVELRWLPVGGMSGPKSYILPAITLAAFPIASLTRIVRSAVADTLNQDYIRTARAKGLSSQIVLRRHALRSSMIPILTILGIQWSAFIGGSVIVETIFAWPGVGRLMAEAISSRDFAVVQSGVVVITALVVTTNFLTDLAYLAVDPRYRAGSGG
jgi:peptide/nickel transport system permease protein